MPLTREQTDTINSLVRNKKIDEARKLLTGWKATDALAKLNARYPVISEEPPIAEQRHTTSNTKEPRKTRRGIVLLGVLVLALLVATYFLWASGAFNGYGCNNFC